MCQSEIDTGVSEAERGRGMSVFRRGNFWWIDFYDSNGKRRRKKVSPDKRVATTTLRDIQVKTVMLHKTKNNESRIVPLNAEALKALDTLPRPSDSFTPCSFPYVDTGQNHYGLSPGFPSGRDR
jgi:hypothetical protein